MMRPERRWTGFRMGVSFGVFVSRIEWVDFP